MFEYLRPTCKIETKDHWVHSLSTLYMREMRETALRDLLRLKVINDVMEDIIKRKQAIAPLKKLKIVSLYDIEQPFYDLKVFYLPSVQLPQKTYQKILLEQKVSEQFR